MGTVNFGNDVFVNRGQSVVALHRAMQERGIVSEYEIFDPGHLASLRRSLDKYSMVRQPVGMCTDMVMAVPGDTAALVPR